MKDKIKYNKKLSIKQEKKKKAKKKLKKSLKISKKKNRTEFNVLDLKEMLPPGYRGSINNDTLVYINRAIKKAASGEQFRNYLFDFSHAMMEGKYSVKQYIDAVKFVSYKFMDYTNEKAYKHTFPGKYKRIIKEFGKKGISPRVHSYFRSKIVQKILAQAVLPPHVLFQDNFYKAIKEQTRLLNAKSELVRQKAANSLMDHLKPPEDTKLQLDIGTSGAEMLNDMLNTLIEVGEKQKKLIKNKTVNAKQVIEGDFQRK